MTDLTVEPLLVVPNPATTNWVPVGPSIIVPPGIAYGTSLPASPTDGQEAILVDVVTNPTYQWRFRYNAGSTSAYKWECVGGSPVWRQVYVNALFNTLTSAPSGLWTHSSINFTNARAGDYLLRGHVFLFAANAGGFNVYGFAGGSLTSGAAYSSHNIGASGNVSLPVDITFLSMATSTLFGACLAGPTGGGGDTLVHGITQVIPLRVA